MLTDMLLNSSLVPVSKSLYKIIKEIHETIEAANVVLVGKESFAMLSSYLDSIVPILDKLKNFQSAKNLNRVMDILAKEIKVAKQQAQECSKGKKRFLLLNCRKIVKHLQLTTTEISRALNLITLALLDLLSNLNEEIGKLSDNMQMLEFGAAAAEEVVLEKIKPEIQERNTDCSYANSLMVPIAEVVGVSNYQSALKRKLVELKNELKNEIVDVQIRKDQQEAIQMDQIIALLGRVDAAVSPEEKEKKYYSKWNSFGNQPLELLQSFYCPITQDVRVDPVETSSGQTFERSAIEKWFTDGNTTCPLTMTSLNRKILRPNITLWKSIEEWKDRNTMIITASMKSKLSSSDEQDILQCLSQLQDLYKERDLHREWVALENYIPILVGFLGGSNRQMRSRALSILCLLAKHNDNNKKRIAEADNSIEFVVHSLTRPIDESELAVVLLLELSKNDMVCNNIGKVQGCILLLVTITNSDNAQAAKDAYELLENLSFIDQNVVQMAKANYFKPLLQRLSSGSNASKIIMAKALSEMELTDHGKATLFDNGVLEPLLHLILEGDAEVKQVAFKALQNLSSLPRNGLQMIREGAVGPLLSLLHYTSSQTLREQAAATIMNLTMSATVSRSWRDTSDIAGI